MPEILDEDDLEYKMEDEDWDSTEYSKKKLGFDPAIKLSEEDEKEIAATAKKLFEEMMYSKHQKRGNAWIAYRQFY